MKEISCFRLLVRKMILALATGEIPELDCIHRAILIAGHALGTPALPLRASVHELYIPEGTYTDTFPATRTTVKNTVLPVRGILYKCRTYEI